MVSFDAAAYDPVQVELMKETIVVVDNDDNALRADSKEVCHLMTNINQGLLHRAFSVFLFNSKNELLLQQRASSKITFPLMWTNTCCSHMFYIDAELDPKDHMGAKRAGQRKLLHELGIKPEEVPLEDFKFLTRIHYMAPSGGPWGEHEIDYILFIKREVAVDVNTNEVEAYKYVTQDDLKQLIKEADEAEAAGNTEGVKLTPWFRLIANTFLFKWWSNIDNLESMADPNTIHRLV